MQYRPTLSAEQTIEHEIMQFIAVTISKDLQVLQESAELSALLRHPDPEIRQEAARISSDISRLIVYLDRI